MEHRYRRYIWMALAVILLLAWAKKDDISALLVTKPSLESLSFSNQGSKQKSPAETPQFAGQEAIQKNTPIVPLIPQADVQEKKNVIVSNDELININVFEKVHAAVVNIATTSLSVDFFMQVTPQQGQGTGFIIDKRGYILTNNHVIENAQEIAVTLSNGKKLSATLVGRDSTSDIAVIKISDNSINDVVELGDSNNLQVGQKALAIGNPFGLGQTLTTGIISALNRSIVTEDNTQIDDIIQTDAPINPGNSGGPLLNSSGEVIGITSSIYSTSGGYQGIGFAIPINQAKDIATQLISTGRVARPWLGIASGISVSELSGYFDFGVDKGLLIVQIYQGSPADKASLRGGDRMVRIGFYRLYIGGDIVTAIDGISISDSNDIDRVLRKKKIGDRIKVKIVRDGRPMEVMVPLTEKPTR
jgi:S1-C subfamily serine protease